MEAPFGKIAVVGMGLVGASFAAAVRKAWPETALMGVDVLPETLAVAAERGWVTNAAAPDSERFRDFVQDGCDLVVLATPVGVVEPYFEKIVEWGYQGIVTDVASTKSRIVEMASSILEHPERYVPGHPMAGSEKNGIDGARPGLFEGAHWILCPDESTPAEYFSSLHALLTGIGARVVSLPRESHDEAVAIVSHVPHMVASSLVELACRHADDQQVLFRLAAGGFKDSTRIAAGSPQLWTGIAFDNAESIRAGLDEVRDILGQFSDALAAGDKRRMRDLLDRAADARRALPAAWVPSTERLLEVRIPMLNRKGVVAEVTTIASQVGCNIQSIDIDHITADSAVLSMVLTDEGDVGQLSSRLIDAGYSVSFSPLTAKEHVHVE